MFPGHTCPPITYGNFDLKGKTKRMLQRPCTQSLKHVLLALNRKSLSSMIFAFHFAARTLKSRDNHAPSSWYYRRWQPVWWSACRRGHTGCQTSTLLVPQPQKTAWCLQESVHHWRTKTILSTHPSNSNEGAHSPGAVPGAGLNPGSTGVWSLDPHPSHWPQTPRSHHFHCMSPSTGLVWTFNHTLYMVLNKKLGCWIEYTFYSQWQIISLINKYYQQIFISEITESKENI